MAGSFRLVQIASGASRRVARVDEPHLRLLRGWDSVYELANRAIVEKIALTQLIDETPTDGEMSYDDVYSGKGEWRLILPIDHPAEFSRSLVSGTGLTHLGSAKERDSMHQVAAAELTDSMKMFQWGVEGGKPTTDSIGVAPEWFYKGNGMVLRGPGEPLTRPNFAEDAGEEGEIAGIYIIAPDGVPRRVGMCIGNEFADHRFEKRNYLNLAGSKIRSCSIGPELVIDPAFDEVPGSVSIERDGRTLWSTDIRSGHEAMCHSLQNIEHHHFKFDTHRRVGDLHVHYFGACALSFSAGVELVDGDVMTIAFNDFGRPLRNPLQFDHRPETLVEAVSLS